MNYVLFIIKFMIPVLSLAGIMLVLYDIFRLNPAFLPLISVSSVTLIVYSGGIFGILPQTVYAVYIAGIAVLAFELLKAARGKFSFMPILRSPALAIFVLCSIYFIIKMHNMVLVHVDNFSHWATIAREICLTDSFPVSGTAVTFIKYTPGSSSFIYFICKAISYTEGNALTAQGILLSSAIAVIFCNAKWKRPLTVIFLFITAVITVSMLELDGSSLHIYNLLVDGLIAFIAVSGGIIAYYYRSDLRRCAASLIPVLSLLCIIKSSARIFAMMIALMAIISVRKQIFYKGALRYSGSFAAPGLIIALIGLQLLFPAMWSVYTNRIFGDRIDISSKFPSSLSELSSIFISKSPEYLNDIQNKMKAEFFSSDMRVIIVAEIFALLVLLTAVLLKQKPHLIVRVLAAANFTGIFYLAELYVLYAYIFPESEATVLASFYRYTATCYDVAGALHRRNIPASRRWGWARLVSISGYQRRYDNRRRLLKRKNYSVQ